MKAVCVHQYDGPASLQIKDIAVPEPGPGEVRIKVAAAGMNHSDLQTTYGTYGRRDRPHGLGQEAAGEVVAVGAGVADFKPGMRVVGRVSGAFADQAIGSAVELLPLPEAVPYEVAASLPIAYLTASLALVHKTKIQTDEWVLVHPGSGGVGSAATQLAKILGARVIATTSSEEKVEYLATLGADEVLVYGHNSIAEEVKQMTHGQGAQIAIDGGGHVTLPHCLAAIANEGRIVSYGYTTGLNATVPLGQLIGRNVSLYGIALWTNRDYAAAWKTFRDLVIPGIINGTLQSYIQRVDGLSGVADALTQLEQHRISGKVVIIL